MKMNKIAFAVIAALCAFTFFSCDLLMTPILPESILKYAPEAGELDEVETEDLVIAASDISIVADPDAAKAVIEALGKKPEDEIKNLSDEQKSTILALTTSAVLPVNTLLGTVYDLMEGNTNRIVLDVAPVEYDDNNAGQAEEEQIFKVIKSVVSKIHFVDTLATEKILLAMKTAWENDNNIIPAPLEVPNVLFATFSVALSACKSNLKDYQNVEELAADMEPLAAVFEDIDENNPPDSADIAHEVLAAISVGGEEGINPIAERALKNALDTIIWLSQVDISLDKITEYIGFGA